MDEAQKSDNFKAFVEDFVKQTKARSEEIDSVQQEIDLLNEQITTKSDHLRQLSERRNNLFGKNQSIRNAQTDAAMKYMTDWIEMLGRVEGKADA